MKKIVRATYGQQSKVEGRDYSKNVFMIIDDNGKTKSVSLHQNILTNVCKASGIKLPARTGDQLTDNAALNRALGGTEIHANIVFHQKGDTYKRRDDKGNETDEVATIANNGYHFENPLDIIIVEGMIRRVEEAAAKSITEMLGFGGATMESMLASAGVATPIPEYA